MDYFISDLHLGHKNIIRYCNRPFNTIELMDNTIINNWNAIITSNDTVFLVGDVCFKKSKKEITDIINSLNGTKILIMGNHDYRLSVKEWLSVGFSEVYKYPIIYKDFYIVSHKPVFMNSTMPYINIHGHIHQNTMAEIYYYNVSVEHHNYTPVSFDNIVKEIEERKIKEVSE